MKKYLFAIAAMGAALTASAQSDIFDNPDNHDYFGARISLDVSSTAGGNDTYSNGAGFNIGAIYNIPLYKNLYLEPGLSIFYDTFGEDVIVNDPAGIQAPYTIDGSIRNFGFRIPLVAGYHFDFTDDVQISFFTGPQFNLSLTAKEHINGDSESIFGDGGFKHVDLQWALGVGATWQKYYVAISGGIGMTKVRDHKVTFFDPDIHTDVITYQDSFRRNTFSITLGYNF